jgi:Tfp pilus assembly protein PilO
MRADVEALQGRVAHAQSEVQRGSVAAVTLPALEKEIRELERELEAFEPLAHEPMDSTTALAELQSAASHSRLRITAIKPRIESGVQDLDGVTFELGVEGSFHSFGRFLGLIAASTRVMTTSDLSVRAQTSRGAAGNVAGSVAITVYGVLVESAIPDDTVENNESGWRDPFASLVAPQPPPVAVAAPQRTTGLAGTSLSDVTVRGIARDGTRVLAILDTGSRQSFVVRRLDRLADSVVHDINPSGVLFIQDNGRGGQVPVYKPLLRSNLEKR